MRVYKATVEAVKNSCTPNHSELVCRWDYSERVFTMEVPTQKVLPVKHIMISAQGVIDHGEPLFPEYMGAAPFALVG